MLIINPEDWLACWVCGLCGLWIELCDRWCLSCTALYTVRVLSCNNSFSPVWIIKSETLIRFGKIGMLWSWFVGRHVSGRIKATSGESDLTCCVVRLMMSFALHMINEATEKKFYFLSFPFLLFFPFCSFNVIIVIEKRKNDNYYLLLKFKNKRYFSFGLEMKQNDAKWNRNEWCDAKWKKWNKWLEIKDTKNYRSLLVKLFCRVADMM